MRIAIPILVLTALAYVSWLAYLSYFRGRHDEFAVGRVHVLDKVPARETEERFERIDLMTMSTVSAAIPPPRELIVEYQDRNLRCRCTRLLYDRVRIGEDVSATVRLRDDHCFINE